MSELKAVLEPYECFVLGKMAGVVRLKICGENQKGEEGKDGRFHDCLDKNNCGIGNNKGYFDWERCPAYPNKTSRFL